MFRRPLHHVLRSRSGADVDPKLDPRIPNPAGLLIGEFGVLLSEESDRPLTSRVDFIVGRILVSRRATDDEALLPVGA